METFEDQTFCGCGSFLGIFIPSQQTESSYFMQQLTIASITFWQAESW